MVWGLKSKLSSRESKPEQTKKSCYAALDDPQSQMRGSSKISPHFAKNIDIFLKVVHGSYWWGKSHVQVSKIRPRPKILSLLSLHSRPDHVLQTAISDWGQTLWKTTGTLVEILALTYCSTFLTDVQNKRECDHLLNLFNIRSTGNSTETIRWMFN